MSNITVPQTAVKAARSRAWKWIVAMVGAVVVVGLAFLGYRMWRMNYVPSDLDFSTTHASAQGAFSATIRPAIDPIPTNKIHSWTLHLQTPDGKPVENATITLKGDMPQHGHGMPTQPEVSKYLGNGDYLVEGMKFQMTGWWVVDFDVNAGGKTDRVSFNLMLK